MRDEVTGEVVAARAESVGIASNNVAEYSGLVSGLMAVFDIDPGAAVTVRLDLELEPSAAGHFHLCTQPQQAIRFDGFHPPEVHRIADDQPVGITTPTTQPDASGEPALVERLLRATTAAAQRYPVAGVTPEALGVGMLPSLLTPLGQLTDGLPLAGIPVPDRLSELNFEFALGNAHTRTTLAAVADLLGRWRLGAPALAAASAIVAAPPSWRAATKRAPPAASA